MILDIVNIKHTVNLKPHVNFNILLINTGWWELFRVVVRQADMFVAGFLTQYSCYVLTPGLIAKLVNYHGDPCENHVDVTGVTSGLYGAGAFRMQK